MNLSINDFIAVGDATTTARRLRAVCSLSSNSGVTFLYRSNEKVNTGLRTAEPNLSRSTLAEKSKRAGGTTSKISVSESDRSIASRGPTTYDTVIYRSIM